MGRKKFLGGDERLRESNPKEEDRLSIFKGMHRGEKRPGLGEAHRHLSSSCWRRRTKKLKKELEEPLIFKLLKGNK